MSRPLRILQYITPSGIGGAEQHLASLAEQLRRRGHQITVICPQGRPLVAELVARGLPVLTPRSHGKVDPLLLARLVTWIRRGSVDVIHTHLSTASLLGSWAARLARIPCLATVHGLNSRTCFSWASHVIAVSAAVKQHLVSQGLPEARVSVIHNGVDTEAPVPSTDPRKVRARWQIPEGAPLLVAVGRLAPEKGHPHLLEAMAQLSRVERWRDLRLLLVGTGPMRGGLEAEAARLGVAGQVVLTGFQREVQPLLRAADVFVLPSLQEGLSLSLLEAMSAGKPVVASRAGGVPEVVSEGETGLLVPPGEPAALAAALARLLSDPGEAARMGAAGRRRVQAAFSIRRMVSRLEECYYSLVGQQARRADRRAGNTPGDTDALP